MIGGSSNTDAFNFNFLFISEHSIRCVLIDTLVWENMNYIQAVIGSK